MSFNLDDANVGGQLKVGSAIVPAIGEGALGSMDQCILKVRLLWAIRLHFHFCYCQYCTTD